MMKQYDVAVIGGGASGMVAAISAARNGASVLILEHMDTVGKKILATGNGKCNYTNSRQGIEWYYGDDPAFVLSVFSQFGQPQTVEFFEELGIYPKVRNGYYYPASEQATSIRDVLIMELKRLHVEVICNVGIRSISKSGNGFIYDTKQGSYYSKRCIMATGGKAAKKSGSDGSGFLYLTKLGHHTTTMTPALVQLIGKQSFFKEIAGVRIEAGIRLYIDDQQMAVDSGELQLTDYGISGIPVFQVSRFASKALSEGRSVYALLDLAPTLTMDELQVLLTKRCQNQYKNAAEALVGMYPSKLIPVILQLAGIDQNRKCRKLDHAQIQKLNDVIKNIRVDITGTKSFDFAQTTAGGIITTEIVNKTLESRLMSGLYFAGEVIDIDGKCGGYNLQWAWSSGFVAGYHASMEKPHDR